MTDKIIQPTRIYQDRLFKAIFGREEHKSYLLELYNALNNSNYTNPDDLKINTIENIIYVTMKNDVSFLIDSQLTLYEQQSSYNPNMPLRGLLYFAQLYQEYLTSIDKNLFTTKLIKIPTPNFVVFYTGLKETEEKVKLKLSEAFEKPKETNEFEWTATMMNINSNHNQPLLKKCKPLYYYSEFVAQVKKNLRNGLAKEDAMNKAVDFAIKNNFLNGFFQKQKMEVLNMSLTEFDQEQYERQIRAEGFEDGHNEGISQGEHNKAVEAAKNLIQMKLGTLEQIAECTKLSVEEVESLVKTLEVKNKK